MLLLTGIFGKRKSRVDDFLSGLIIIGILVSMFSPSSSTGIGSGKGRLVTSTGALGSSSVLSLVFALSSVLVGD